MKISADLDGFGLVFPETTPSDDGSETKNSDPWSLHVRITDSDYPEWMVRLLEMVSPEEIDPKEEYC